MKKQKGLSPDPITNNKSELNSFLEWYNEDSNPKSFFINGMDLTDISAAYRQQNTTNSIHSSDLIKSFKK